MQVPGIRMGLSAPMANRPYSGSSSTSEQTVNTKRMIRGAGIGPFIKTVTMQYKHMTEGLSMRKPNTEWSNTILLHIRGESGTSPVTPYSILTLAVFASPCRLQVYETRQSRRYHLPSKYFSIPNTYICPVRCTKFDAPREQKKWLFGGRTSEAVIFTGKYICTPIWGYAVGRHGCCASK